MIRNVLRVTRAGWWSVRPPESRVYGVIDSSESPVARLRQLASTMNVVFDCPPRRSRRFLEQATEQGMSGLKGHRSVGGLRASIYNAAPYEWADRLAQFMTDFEAKNG